MMVEVMTLREVAEKVAWSHVNRPYRWGGDDPITGFDCSGLVVEILKSVGVLPREGDWTAAGLHNRFKDKGTVLEPDSGCLVFWGNDRITHVEYCIGNGLTIGASGGGSATTSDSAAAAQNAYVKVRPIRKPYSYVVDPFYEVSE